MPQADIERLSRIEAQILWTACWMVHNANHLRPSDDGDVKVGGHQASTASLVSILTALYFHTLRPEDRVAVKPHASPAFHAIQYIAGNQTREKLQAFRGFKGAQSYPSRTKDIDDVDFSTGSVGLGGAITVFASLVQDYLHSKAWADPGPKGRMISLLGDAELDEGNLFECLQEGWKHDVRNVWWIVDYNRQSLDGVVREGLWKRIEDIFRSFGWTVVSLKYGAKQRAAFGRPGGDALRRWIDECSNQDYSALTFQGGDAWKKRLLADLANDAEAVELIRSFEPPELADLMQNLGGHCLETLTDAFDDARSDRPTVFLAYTIKGYGTPLAGHKDNHAGLMTAAQIDGLRQRLDVAQGEEWEPLSTIPAGQRQEFRSRTRAPFFERYPRRFAARTVEREEPVWLSDKTISTQAAFGKVLDAIGKREGGLAERIVTTSPDVTVSTNLGPWVNRRGLFARHMLSDRFMEEKIPSTQKWKFSPEGQHIELGIAEMNLFSMLAAAGLSHSLWGERLIPIGTLYDPFIMRGLDALNYGCYMDSRFILAATPSGVTLAPEGGAHQSIATPLIGLAQDGLASFEPAFADEVSAILAWSFDYIQRDGGDDFDETTWLRDETGGSVYLRLSTRPLQQELVRKGATFEKSVVDGAYWMRPPGPNAEVVIVYQGAIAPEAISAVGQIMQSRRDVGLLAVTSADRLHAGWSAAKRERRRGSPDAASHIERLLADLPSHCLIVTVIDGHPLTLSWIGSVQGHRTVPLGVEHFGQTGRIADLYQHFEIDAQAIVEAVETLSTGRRSLHAIGHR